MLRDLYGTLGLGAVDAEVADGGVYAAGLLPRLARFMRRKLRPPLLRTSLAVLRPRFRGNRQGGCHIDN
jgi:hypothetical protein